MFGSISLDSMRLLFLSFGRDGSMVMAVNLNHESTGKNLKRRQEII